MAAATNEVYETRDDDGADEPVLEARIGTVISGTYRLVRQIGSGGSGHVFEAEHLRLGKSFALKVLRPQLSQDQRGAWRFRREITTMARLKSEFIVSVVDCGELDDRTPYLVMELLEGEDLRSLLSRAGRLPVRRAVGIIVEACRGLRVVHDAGLVHRDLKPENLFITRRATGEDWCKIVDFGVAKSKASTRTAQGAIVGTVRYMAPEQLVDSGSVGRHTDVYALSAVLYECLAGRALHPGEALHEVMYSVMHRGPSPLDEHRVGLPVALVDAVHRGLSRDPSARPATTTELASLLIAATSTAPSVGGADLTLAEDEPPRATPTPSPRSRPWPSRWLGIAATTCLAGTALGWLARSEARAEPEPAAHAKQTVRSAPSASVAVQPAAFAPMAAPIQLPTTDADAAAQPTAARKPALARKSPAAGAASIAPPDSRAAPVARFDETNPYGQ